MGKYYKHNKIIKVLVMLGGISGFLYGIYRIWYMSFTFNSIFALFEQIFRINGFLGYVMGMFIASLTVLVAFKPDDPIPWHWLVILLLGILLSTLSFLLGGIAVLIAGVIGLIDEI
ncbi:MAG: hypothetical protein ACW972_07650 [Promethearchaeota archaeon]|jgi:hypothetical protein